MNHVRFHGAMRPSRALRTRDNPYRRRDTRPSGKHPSDKWLLVMFAVTAVILWVWP